MASPGTSLEVGAVALWGARDHLQERSRRSAIALVAAARELLQTRDYGDITVGDIASAAGTSVGGFYARFESKSALLEVILATVSLEADDALGSFLEEAPGTSAAHFVKLWADLMVRVFRTHRREIQQALKHLPDGPAHNSRTARELTRLRDRARGAFRSELARRSVEIRHADPDLAIGVALMLGTVGLREAIIGNAMGGYGIEVDDEGLGHEVATCISRYLGLGFDE